MKRLINTYYDDANKWYELEFEDGEIIQVNSEDYPEAKYDEYFWDNEERIKKILNQKL